mmetsp:Transcript_8951/g.19380  ORF Transcript_8951/g.19380 Transcript_8951/m.19380 type:complete len:201 (-) Transcript_8951:885-1487(-)
MSPRPSHPPERTPPPRRISCTLRGRAQTSRTSGTRGDPPKAGGGTGGCPGRGSPGRPPPSPTWPAGRGGRSAGVGGTGGGAASARRCRSPPTGRRSWTPVPPLGSSASFPVFRTAAGTETGGSWRGWGSPSCSSETLPRRSSPPLRFPLPRTRAALSPPRATPRRPTSGICRACTPRWGCDRNAPTIAEMPAGGRGSAGL